MLRLASANRETLRIRPDLKMPCEVGRAWCGHTHRLEVNGVVVGVGSVGEPTEAFRRRRKYQRTSLAQDPGGVGRACGPAEGVNQPTIRHSYAVPSASPFVAPAESDSDARHTAAKHEERAAAKFRPVGKDHRIFSGLGIVGI